MRRRHQRALPPTAWPSAGAARGSSLKSAGRGADEHPLVRRCDARLVEDEQLDFDQRVRWFNAEEHPQAEPAGRQGVQPALRPAGLARCSAPTSMSSADAAVEILPALSALARGRSASR